MISLDKIVIYWLIRLISHLSHWLLGRGQGERSMPGLFSVHFSKDHSTDEIRPVDQFLKGVEDGKVSTGSCERGRV